MTYGSTSSRLNVAAEVSRPTWSLYLRRGSAKEKAGIGTETSL
jgi:hypothetical protein